MTTLEETEMAMPDGPTAETYLPLDAESLDVDAAWEWAEAAVERMATQRRLILTATTRSVVHLAVWEDEYGDFWYRLPVGDDVATTQRLRVVGHPEA